jgi:hypothetical protein
MNLLVVFVIGVELWIKRSTTLKPSKQHVGSILLTSTHIPMLKQLILLKSFMQLRSLSFCEERIGVYHLLKRRVEIWFSSASVVGCGNDSVHH